MKTKSILKHLSTLLIVIFALSSCNSSIQIVKKRHSNGYYVNVGSDTHKSTDFSNAAKHENKKIKLQDETLKTESMESDEVSNTERIVSTSTKIAKRAESKTKSESKNTLDNTKKEKTSTISKIKKIKALKKELKKSKNNDVDTNTLLLVILAILLPPLAVYLLKGLTTQFWISLILTLLFWLPGIIYALLLIFGAI